MGKPAPRVVSRRGLRGREPFGKRRPPRRAARVPLAGYAVRRRPRQKGCKWQIEAFLVNGKSGYAERRDKLREALNASGPGTLIHPYLGELSVSVDGYSLKETTREGGYCTFSISFVEAGQPVEPDVEKDTAANVLDKAEAAKEAATAGFLDEYMPLLEDLEGSREVPALFPRRRPFSARRFPSFPGRSPPRQASLRFRIVSPAGSSGIWEPSASLAALRRPV